MKSVVVTSCFILMFLGACSSAPKPVVDTAAELDKLLVLYEKNKPKFVIQKQKMVQASNCKRATRLHNEAKSRVKAAELSPEDNGGLIAVQRELAQAEKDCLAAKE